jgi:hypothetical protein
MVRVNGGTEQAPVILLLLPLQTGAKVNIGRFPALYGWSDRLSLAFCCYYSTGNFSGSAMLTPSCGELH